MVGGDLAERPLVERFGRLKELGFDGVELDSPNNFTREEVLAAKRATGLEIPGVVDSVHWRDRLNDPDPAVRRKGIDALSTALRDAAAYGATSVLLVPGKVTKQDGYAECYRLSQQAIREVLPLAAELKVTIALENVWNNFLLSPIEFAHFVDELDSPWVGVHFDVGNVVRFGWPEHWVRTLAHRLVRIDVKEYSRRKRSFEVDLMTGDCDWPEVMKALGEVRYRGWFTAEMRGGDRPRLQQIAAGMDRILGLG
ncbi:MAG: sugar phosphate isomerase/epimerase [Planctomycetes bacterium]|nr:sugar phosphate isomerase/epimerase [Planctomycetota bacterium]